MPSKDVKFNYYELFRLQTIDGNPTETPFLDACSLLLDIHQLGREQSRFDMRNSRICFLESLITTPENHLIGTFATAQHDYRPPVIDTSTLSERPNPRSINEGDKNRIYFAIVNDRSTNPHLTLILQKNVGSGFSIKNFRSYLIHFYSLLHNQRIRLRADGVMGPTFFNELSRMSRASSLEVSYDKQIVGNRFSAFSQNASSMQRDITISAKASKGLSITEAVSAAARSMFGDNQDRISRIVVKGKDDADHKLSINTDDLAKVSVESIETVRDTGELDHNAAVNILKYLANSY